MAEHIAAEEILALKSKPSTKGMTVKVMKGSFWVLIGQILPLLATFIATPFVIRFLGSESYGVLILVGVISSYFSFGDFGMNLASTRYGSEAYAHHSGSAEGLVVRTAATIALGSSLIIAIPMFLFSGWIVGDLLKVPVPLQAQAGLALKITSGAYVLNILAGVFNTPQLSRMKMGMNVLITAGSKVIMLLITPVVLYFGGGIVDATIVAFCAAFTILAGNIIVSGRLLPELFNASINKKIVRPLLRFGGNVVLYSIGLTIINYLDKLLLTRFVSVKSLAYYSIAFTFANMTTMFSMAMVQTLIPAFSQLLTPDKKSQLNSLFARSIRVGILGILPSIMFLMVIARPFFSIWAGKEFGLESVYPFYILLVGIFFGILVYVPNCLLMAIGRSEIFARFYLLEIIPYALLCYVLINQFGIIGAAMSWSIRECINAIVFIGFAKRHTGTSFDFYKQLGKIIPCILILSPPMLFAALYDNYSLWLIGLVPVCLALYFWFVWKSLVDADEKVWITETVKRIGKRIRILK